MNFIDITRIIQCLKFANRMLIITFDIFQTCLLNLRYLHTLKLLRYKANQDQLYVLYILYKHFYVRLFIWLYKWNVVYSLCKVTGLIQAGIYLPIRLPKLTLTVYICHSWPGRLISEQIQEADIYKTMFNKSATK